MSDPFVVGLAAFAVVWIGFVYLRVRKATKNRLRLIERVESKHEQQHHDPVESR